MYDSLIKSLNTYARLSDQEIEDFVSCVKPQSYAKGELLLDVGTTCRTFNFIQNGSFRQYLNAKDYEEVTLNFFLPNEWVLDVQSFTAQKPSKTNIVAFEDSEVLVINIHALHELIAKSQNFFALGRILESKPNDYKTFDQSPEEKYRALLKTKPEWVQHFPLKHIASFLGMTPETLSRVRSKIQ